MTACCVLLFVNMGCCLYVQGQYLAVGTHSGAVQIWDASSEKRVLSLKGHLGRVGKIILSIQELFV